MDSVSGYRHALRSGLIIKVCGAFDWHSGLEVKNYTNILKAIFLHSRLAQSRERSANT